LSTYGGDGTWADHLYIYNNTFVNDLSFPTVCNVAELKNPIDTYFKNNIFYNQKNKLLHLYGDTTGLVIDYNLIYNTNGSSPASLTYPITYPFLHTLYVNPQFVNPSAQDFHLQPGSPACTGGENGTYIGAYPCNSVPPTATNTPIPATQTSTATRTPVPNTITPIPATKTPTATVTFTPTPAPLVSFNNGFENGLIYKDSGLANTWMHHFYNAGDIVLETGIVRAGNNSIKVKVQPGSYSAVGGERSMVVYMTKPDGTNQTENENSGAVYVTVSVYLPLDWKVNLPQFGVVLQLHGPDSVWSVSPAFELDATDRFYIANTAGDYDVGFSSKRIELSDNNLNLGHWTDFVVKIIPSKTNGTIQVWRRNEGATTFTEVLNKTNIPTLQYQGNNAVMDHYWTAGYYRHPDTTTNILYIDSIVRGTSFDAVVSAAFPNPIIPIKTPTPSPIPTFTQAPTATATKIPQTFTSVVTLSPTWTATHQIPTNTRTATPTFTATPTYTQLPATWTPTATITPIPPSPKACVEILWSRGLNMRHEPSMFNTTQGGYLTKGMIFKPLDTHESWEGVFVKFGQDWWVAFDLSWNNNVYAIFVECP
jgi:hypothetical protein